MSANLKLSYLFSLVEHANFNVQRNVEAVYFSLDLLASTAAFWEEWFHKLLLIHLQVCRRYLVILIQSHLLYISADSIFEVADGN